MVHPLLNQRAPVLTLADSNGEPYELTPGKDGVPTAIFFYPTSGGRSRLHNELLLTSLQGPTGAQERPAIFEMQ